MNYDQQRGGLFIKKLTPLIKFIFWRSPRVLENLQDDFLYQVILFAQMQLSVGISLKLKNQISNKVTVNEIQLLSENLFAWFKFMCILAYKTQGYVFPLCCQCVFFLTKK